MASMFLVDQPPTAQRIASPSLFSLPMVGLLDRPPQPALLAKAYRKSRSVSVQSPRIGAAQDAAQGAAQCAEVEGAPRAPHGVLETVAERWSMDRAAPVTLQLPDLARDSFERVLVAEVTGRLGRCTGTAEEYTSTLTHVTSSQGSRSIQLSQGVADTSPQARSSPQARYVVNSPLFEPASALDECEWNAPTSAAPTVLLQDPSLGPHAGPSFEEAGDWSPSASLHQSLHESTPSEQAALWHMVSSPLL